MARIQWLLFITPPAVAQAQPFHYPGQADPASTVVCAQPSELNGETTASGISPSGTVS